ncbi:MAG: hypothetical protein M3281_01390, partial [Chloroflexota bacterium]|nr:hypothetical protein [Chloroflexota bacterium]
MAAVTTPAVQPTDPPAESTVVAAGWKIRLQQAGAPAKTSRQSALATARQELTATQFEIVTEPRAEYWLATNPGQPNPDAGTYMEHRPVWVVSFDSVLARPLSGGPAQTGPDQQAPSHEHYPARVRVFVDDGTGAIIMTSGDSLGP